MLPILNSVDEIYYKAGACAKAYSEHLFEKRLKWLKNKDLIILKR